MWRVYATSCLECTRYAKYIALFYWLLFELGISLKTTSQGLRVTSVKKGSSAAEELRSNDLITAINDDIVVGLSLEAAITKLEGGGAPQLS